MSTSAQIRSAWDRYVFQNASIQAITPKYYSFEVTEESEAEVSQAYDGGQVNFFEYVVTPGETSYLLIGGANAPQTTYLVEVRYTKWSDPQDPSFNDVIDALETLIGVVQNSLGNTWQGTVDFIESPITVEPPQAQKFNETDCYRAVARFTGIKQI